MSGRKVFRALGRVDERVKALTQGQVGHASFAAVASIYSEAVAEFTRSTANVDRQAFETGLTALRLHIDNLLLGSVFGNSHAGLPTLRTWKKSFVDDLDGAVQEMRVALPPFTSVDRCAGMARGEDGHHSRLLAVVAPDLCLGGNDLLGKVGAQMESMKVRGFKVSVETPSGPGITPEVAPCRLLVPFSTLHSLQRVAVTSVVNSGKKDGRDAPTAEFAEATGKSWHKKRNTALPTNAENALGGIRRILESQREAQTNQDPAMRLQPWHCRVEVLPPCEEIDILRSVFPVAKRQRTTADGDAARKQEIPAAVPAWATSIHMRTCGVGYAFSRALAANEPTLPVVVGTYSKTLADAARLLKVNSDRLIEASDSIVAVHGNLSHKKVMEDLSSTSQRMARRSEVRHTHL